MISMVREENEITKSYFNRMNKALNRKTDFIKNKNKRRST